MPGIHVYLSGCQEGATHKGGPDLRDGEEEKLISLSLSLLYQAFRKPQMPVFYDVVMRLRFLHSSRIDATKCV